MKKHLNWTIGISTLLFWLFVDIAIHIGNLPLCILASIGSLVMLGILGWALEQKGRSSWYYFILWLIPLVGLIVLLALPNKRTIPTNSKAKETRN
jgi:hypothetical protein